MRTMRIARGLFGLLAVLTAASAARALRLSAARSHQAAARYEDVYYVPNHAALPVLSLGYRQALADLIWCRSLVYFGEELGQRGAVRHAFDYTDAILALDPGFRSAYRWIATAALYRPADVDVEAGERAARYLERAVARWPDDGELHWDYGSLLRFELAPLLPKGARKDALIARAAPHLEAAARLGAGPPWLGVVNAKQLVQLGRTEQAIRHLEQVALAVREPAAQKELALALANLRAQRDAALRTSDETERGTAVR